MGVFILLQVTNFISIFIQSFASLCGSFELAIVFFTLLIRLIILPIKYPVDLNYLNKSVTKKYFEKFLEYVKMTKDRSIVENLREQEKNVKNNLKFLSLSRILLLISAQTFILILFVRALTRIEHNQIETIQVFSLESYLVALLVLLTSVDYFMKQCLAQQEEAGYVFPFVIGLMMFCASFLFTRLFLIYLVTTYCFNVITFYFLWFFKSPRLQLQAYRIFSDYYL